MKNLKETELAELDYGLWQTSATYLEVSGTDDICVFSVYCLEALG